jgi:hypothetical protein
MKRLCVILLVVFSLASCAGVAENRGLAGGPGYQGKKSMVDDLGSPEKTALLRQRAEEAWTVFVNEDWDKAFYYFDPFFRIRTNKYGWMGTMGKIKWHEYEIKDIKVEGNYAEVTVKIVYSVEKMVVKGARKPISKPKTDAEFAEKWLYIYDNWYKEYFMYAVEEGVVKY